MVQWPRAIALLANRHFHPKVTSILASRKLPPPSINFDKLHPSSKSSPPTLDSVTITKPGLRPINFFTSNPMAPSLVAPVASQRDMRTLHQMLRLQPQTNLDANLHDVIFVCIDCEAFEAMQDKITEIGIAVFDSRDLTPPPPCGNDNDDDAKTYNESWLRKIHHAHFRPIEHSQLRNRRFLKGCEDDFNFGTSGWIRLADAARVLRRVFRDPTRLADAADFSKQVPHCGRKIVFVAHSAGNDVGYLKTLGFPLSDVSNLVRTMDTQVLAGGGKKYPVALLRVLFSLGMDPVNLHNAGNDAAYTLQALLRMAIQDHKSPGSVIIDVGKVVGKIGKARRVPIKAPQIWAGTAVEGEQVPLVKPSYAGNAKQHSHFGGTQKKEGGGSAPQPGPSREQRRRSIKLAQVAREGRLHSLPMQEQKPLPSFDTLGMASAGSSSRDQQAQERL